MNRGVSGRPDDVDVLAAGEVVWRPDGPAAASSDPAEGSGPTIAPRSPGAPASEPEGSLSVAVIHRSRYGDWSLPKGKLENGESMAAAAVREVREETGVTARLGPFLCDVRYPVADGRKLVRYWSAQACAEVPLVPNDEVDELRWVTPDTAEALLSYGHDREVLRRFPRLGPPTSLLVLVRHAKAGRRDDWDGEDRLRPLSKAGRRQAQDLVGLLRLFGPDRIASAPPTRCRDTVAPLADALGLPVGDEPLLGEGCYADDPDATLARVRELAGDG